MRRVGLNSICVSSVDRYPSTLQAKHARSNKLWLFRARDEHAFRNYTSNPKLKFHWRFTLTFQNILLGLTASDQLLRHYYQVLKL